MGRERRKYERVVPAPHAPVEVQIMGSDFLEQVKALDISVGGVGIRVPHGFVGYDVSQRVELILTLPGQTPFKAAGYIRHKSDAGDRTFGVEFNELPDQGRDKIEAYVNLRLRRSAPIRRA